MKRTLRRYRGKRKPRGLQSLSKIRKDYESKFKTQKRVFKQSQIVSLVGSVGNLKDFYKEIRKCKSTKMITHSIDDDEWYRHFEQVCTSGASLEREEPELQDASKSFVELLDGDITEEKIRQALKYLRHRRLGGPSGLVKEISIFWCETVVPF